MTIDVYAFQRAINEAISGDVSGRRVPDLRRLCGDAARLPDPGTSGQLLFPFLQKVVTP